MQFDRTFDPAYGTAVEIAPGIRRLTARNPGGYTFAGTNCYLIGSGVLTVVDPGPDDPEHLDAILAAAGGARISHVLATHTHRDHSPGATALARRTGALLAGCGPHVAARALHAGEANALDASADHDYRPERQLGDGERLETPAAVFRAIATPGHAANHLCFAIEGSGHLLSGDHVMGWSTSIVAPPDGRMADYMASLDRIESEPETRYLPGHGGAVADGPAQVRGLREHRRQREAAVLFVVANGIDTIPAIVAAVYRDVDVRLHAAAALSVFAQVEHLVERGLVETEGEPLPTGRFRVR